MGWYEEVGLHWMNRAAIAYLNDKAKYDMWTLLISIHLIWNAVHDKEDSGYSPAMMKDNMNLVSDDSNEEVWGNRALFYISGN